jgi:hypothetical protein
LVILPLLGVTETPDEQPKTIEEDWNKKIKQSDTKESASKGGISSAGGVYEPAE